MLSLETVRGVLNDRSFLSGDYQDENRPLAAHENLQFYSRPETPFSRDLNFYRFPADQSSFDPATSKDTYGRTNLICLCKTLRSVEGTLKAHVFTVHEKKVAL